MSDSTVPESSAGASNAGTSDVQTSDQSQSHSPESNACANCKKPESSSDPDAPTLKPCITCKSVLYCSRDCKKAHSKQHKKACAALAQEYMKTADVKMASRAPPKAETHQGGLRKWQFDT